MDIELVVAAALLPEISFADLETARRTIDDLVASTPVDFSGLIVTDLKIPRGDGHTAIRTFVPEHSSANLPAVLSLHGGGFAVGSMSLDDGANAVLARTVGAIVVAVDYRLAPEHPFPAAAEDCYAALVWLSNGAGALNVDTDRIAVLGDSAGGGLAATTTLLARDRNGPTIAIQVLLEPELDDRLQTYSMRTGIDTIGWRQSQAVLSWRYYLGDAGVPPLHAAPARTQDLSELPPAYVTVGELDCLRDEGLQYASRLMAAGVPTELHCWPGVFHGFQHGVPTAAVSERANASLFGALRRALVDPPTDSRIARARVTGPQEEMLA
jgi:acetyl esterase